MEKAYIILAHKNPHQLARLIEKLDDGSSYFFLHLDNRVPFSEFTAVAKFNKKLTLVERAGSKWGTFGLVEATLNAMKAVKISNLHFDQVILLSGQDYPIKSNAEINDFFQNSPNKVFIDYVAIPDYKRWKPRGGLYRVDKYFFGLGFYCRYKAKAFNFLARYFKSLNRNSKAWKPFYGGSQWWAMDMYALDYILAFVRKHPGYSSFHKHTFAPDEVFFHTILLASTDTRLSSSIINNNLRLLIWDNTNEAHPQIIRKEDLDRIRSSKALLARKFDEEIDTVICDLIDEHCLNVQEMSV